MNKSGAVRRATAYQRAPTLHLDSIEEVAKASLPVEEAGQEDACYGGAEKHRRAHERDQRLELRLGGQD